MNITRILRGSALLLALSALLTVAATAQPRGPQSQRIPGEPRLTPTVSDERAALREELAALVAQVNLTDEQIAALDAVHASYEENVAAQVDDVANTLAIVRAYVDGAAFANDTEVALATTLGNGAYLRALIRQDIFAVLTPDQAATVEAIRELMRSHRPAPGEGPDRKARGLGNRAHRGVGQGQGPGSFEPAGDPVRAEVRELMAQLGGPLFRELDRHGHLLKQAVGGPGIGKVLRFVGHRLELSTEQREAIHLALDEHRFAMEETRGDGRTLMDALHNAVVADVVDPAAIQAAANAVAAHAMVVLDAKAALGATISNILTDEQRVKLEELREVIELFHEMRGPRRGPGGPGGRFG